MRYATWVSFLSNHDNEVYAVTVTPDSQIAISLSGDGTCAIWRIGATEKRIFRDLGTPRIMTVTADNKFAILAWPGLLATIPLEFDENSTIHFSKGHTGRINDAVATQDSRKVVSVSEDHTVRLWSLESGQLLASLTLDHEIEKAAFVLDGEVVVVGDVVGNVYCLRFRNVPTD